MMEYWSIGIPQHSFVSRIDRVTLFDNELIYPIPLLLLLLQALHEFQQPILQFICQRVKEFNIRRSNLAGLAVRLKT